MKTAMKLALVFAVFWAGAAVAADATASAGSETLEKQFLSPPRSARPWVYWFWPNSNLTREVITADLEAMQRVGIGGVLILDVIQGRPRAPWPSAVRNGGRCLSTSATRRPGWDWK